MDPFIGSDEHANVIEISPFTCPHCESAASEGDTYCATCGGSLDAMKRSCVSCQNPLRAGASFCPSCGAPVSADTVTTSSSDTTATAAPVKLAGIRGAKKKIAMGAVLCLLLASALAAWIMTRPSLEPYDTALRKGLILAAKTQAETDRISDPAGLDDFADAIKEQSATVKNLTAGLDEIKSEEHADTLQTMFVAQADYLEELERLAELPSADARKSEYVRVPELAEELESAMKAAIALRPVDGIEPESLTPTRLIQSLQRLADFRQEVLKERARIKKVNRRRGEKLAELKIFSAQFDSILNRYSESRGELAAWIDDVETYGSTFDEAYRVLAQQSGRRSQLREELSSLAAPAEFAEHKASVMGVMDMAIEAVNAAYDGILDYQYSFRYRFYDQTPGWRQFEAQTDEITSEYSAVRSSYDAAKDRLFRKFKKRLPLPELPA